MNGYQDRIAMLAEISGSSFEKPPKPPIFSRPWRRFSAALCLVIGTGVAVYLAKWIHFASADPQSLARLDQPLPPLVVDASGVDVDLRKFAAGIRCVIVFYSPSCHVCREILPALQPFPASLRLIMVNESTEPEDPKVTGFPGAALFHDRWRVLSRSFAMPTLPTIIFMDEEGILRDGLVGSHERRFVQQKLKEFAIHPYDQNFEKP
jgi:thiol-disulfide isomerase/thioredoxin